MKRVLIGLAAAFLIAGQVFAQQTANELSLDDCIELALKNRASIIAAHGREQLASAGKRSALGAFLPRISASYTASESNVRKIKAGGFDQPDQNNTNKSLQLSGNLTLGLGTVFDHFAASARHDAAKLDVISSKLDLTLAVKRAYYGYLAASENVSVQEEAVKRAEEQLKLIESRFELGSASRSDVLKQKVQHGNDRVALLKAKNLLTTSHANLAYTIGIDPREDWRFSSGYEVQSYDGTLEEAVDYAMQNEPGIASLDRSLSAEGSSVASAASQYLPTITGFASYSEAERTSGDTLSFKFESNSATIGLQLNYTIFDGFLREQTLTRAKVNRNDARAALADARNLAISNIKTAFLDIVQLREQKNVSKENVEAATEDMKITQERYNLGAASILDLLQAQESLKLAQVQLIQADFDLNTKVAELEKAMGKQ